MIKLFLFNRGAVMNNLTTLIRFGTFALFIGTLPLQAEVYLNNSQSNIGKNIHIHGEINYYDNLNIGKESFQFCEKKYTIDGLKIAHIKNIRLYTDHGGLGDTWLFPQGTLWEKLPAEQRNNYTVLYNGSTYTYDETLVTQTGSYMLPDFKEATPPSPRKPTHFQIK
jgi:hypothetical protein